MVAGSCCPFRLCLIHLYAVANHCTLITGLGRVELSPECSPLMLLACTPAITWSATPWLLSLLPPLPAVYTGTKGGVEVFAPDGTKLGTICCGHATNLAFVDHTLYALCEQKIVAIKLQVAGATLP